MRILRQSVIAIVLIMSLAVTLPAVRAQEPLTLNTSVEGSVEDGSSESWTFFAQSGQVLSFLVEAASGDFDPTLTIRDRAGNQLIANDDYAYPETRDALLEAITMPRTDTYTVEVSGFNGTSGDYELTVFSGFAQFAEQDAFGGESDWEPADDVLSVELDEAQLTLSISGADQRGIAVGGLPELADVAARVRVENVSGVSGWIVGLATRRSGSDYYNFEVNNNGLWRFSLIEDGEATVLRDWINHPNIVPGQTAFSLTLLATRSGFEFYYNDGFIGTVSDSTLSEAGEVGVTVGTSSAQNGQATAVFSSLVLTTPLLIDGERVIPQQVIVSEGPVMAQALHQRHVVSAAGTMALTVPNSSVEYARPGVQRLMLGRGIAFSNFALGTTVNIQPSQAGPVGCGLVFRFADETDYTLAFLDATGGYGVSHRQGEDFEPGLFGEDPNFAGSGEHHLLVIADDDVLYYYVDGQYAGTLESPAQEGQVGTAVVNFEGITTNCTYTNLWLWRWDAG